MLKFSRRGFLKGCLAGSAVTTVPAWALTPAPSMGQRFLDWLRRYGISKDRNVRNLVYNFYQPSTQQGSWVFPMVTAKTILWLIKLGHIEEASAMGDALLRWQQVSRAGVAARSYGAFPSSIDQEGEEWIAGDRFYSGDNLAVLQALISLYEKTKNREHLNSAIGVGTWLVTVMCAGQKYGVWKEDHAAPMFYVTRDGALSNHIHVQAEWLWISALRRLTDVAGDSAYRNQADRAEVFFRRAQSERGAFYDHYDPGWPPEPYRASHWRTYGPNQLIADNGLRSALGACRGGDLGTASHFFQWLKTVDGAVPAYLDAKTGGPGFLAGQPIYYDVVASGLYRSLCHWLHEPAAAAKVEAFLKKVQDQNGGFYWGCRASDLKPLNDQQAPMTGLWAVADLSTP